MSHEAHSEHYKGCTIRLVYDESPDSPREWSNVGTMVCWHRRYNLGDEQPDSSPDDYVLQLIELSTWRAELLRRQEAVRAGELCSETFETDEDREAAEQELERSIDAVESDMEEDAALCWQLFDKDNIRLPLYLYDHSGISISTGSFSCPWDSGQVGFIYCSKEHARKEWGEKYNPGITEEEIWEKAEACLRGEVKTYDDYLTGQVVGYVAEDPDGEQIHSCWGFYPDEKGDWPDAIEQAKGEIDAWVEQQEREAAEKAYWETRDVETV
jgi:hypothetical protein